MGSDRKTSRDVILARRALFIASALHGVSAHADQPKGAKPPSVPPPAVQPKGPQICLEPPWDDEQTRRPAPPEAAQPKGPQICLSADSVLGVETEPEPPRPPPMPCLQPPPPTHRDDTNAIDLVICAAPTLLTPLYTTGEPYLYGTSLTLGVRRELTSIFDVSLLATAMPAERHDSAFAPVGGKLRLDTSVITPDEWDPPYRLITSIDVGAGTWLSPSAAGPDRQTWVPTRGPWFSAGSTLVGFRYRSKEGYGAEVGLPIAFLFSTQRSATDDRIAPTYFTIGLSLSFSWQIKERTRSRIIDDLAIAPRR